MSEEKRLTDHIVSWSEERGLEMAKIKGLPYKFPFEDKYNYVNPKVFEAFYFILPQGHPLLTQERRRVSFLRRLHWKLDSLLRRLKRNST
jgi:hypothetical protein